MKTLALALTALATVSSFAAQAQEAAPSAPAPAAAAPAAPRNAPDVTNTFVTIDQRIVLGLDALLGTYSPKMGGQVADALNTTLANVAAIAHKGNVFKDAQAEFQKACGESAPGAEPKFDLMVMYVNTVPGAYAEQTLLVFGEHTAMQTISTQVQNAQITAQTSLDFSTNYRTNVLVGHVTSKCDSTGSPFETDVNKNANSNWFRQVQECALLEMSTDSLADYVSEAYKSVARQCVKAVREPKAREDLQNTLKALQAAQPAPAPAPGAPAAAQQPQPGSAQPQPGAAPAVQKPVAPAPAPAPVTKWK